MHGYRAYFENFLSHSDSVQYRMEKMNQAYSRLSTTHGHLREDLDQQFVSADEHQHMYQTLLTMRKHQDEILASFWRQFETMIVSGRVDQFNDVQRRAQHRER